MHQTVSLNCSKLTKSPFVESLVGWSTNIVHLRLFILSVSTAYVDKWFWSDFHMLISCLFLVCSVSLLFSVQVRWTNVTIHKLLYVYTLSSLVVSYCVIYYTCRGTLTVWLAMFVHFVTSAVAICCAVVVCFVGEDWIESCKYLFIVLQHHLQCNI